MNTDLLRLINGALLEASKAQSRLDDTGDFASDRLDEAYSLLTDVIVLLSVELEELEK